MSITVISLSSEIKDFKNDFEHYEKIKRVIDFTKLTDFRIFSNVEVLMYDGRRIEFSCCYTEYKGKKYITSIYNRESVLIYNYNINYDLIDYNDELEAENFMGNMKERGM